MLFVRADPGAVRPAPRALGQRAGLDLDSEPLHALASPALDRGLGNLKLGYYAELREICSLDALPGGPSRPRRHKA